MTNRKLRWSRRMCEGAMAIMEIRIGKYKIRNLRMDDAESIAKYASNRKVWRNVLDAFPHPYTLEDAHAYLERILAQESPTSFAIATDDEYMGGIAFHLLTGNSKRTAELGYWLGEPF